MFLNTVLNIQLKSMIGLNKVVKKN